MIVGTIVSRRDDTAAALNAHILGGWSTDMRKRRRPRRDYAIGATTGFRTWDHL